MFPIFVNGLSTGFLLQLAVGPVFFFVLNISFQRTIVDGLFAVLAVTLADYLYILLAILGVGKALEKRRIKKAFGIASSFVLIAFGLMMMVSVAKEPATAEMSGMLESNYPESFLSAFLLTVSSPLTILFWTSLFSAKALENNYDKRQLFAFGISAGLATVLFLGISVLAISVVKASIPAMAIRISNLLVGAVLAVYGIVRLFDRSKNKQAAEANPKSGSGVC